MDSQLALLAFGGFTRRPFGGFTRRRRAKVPAGKAGARNVGCCKRGAAGVRFDAADM